MPCNLDFSTAAGTADAEVQLFPAAGGTQRDVAIDTHDVGGGIRHRF